MLITSLPLDPLAHIASFLNEKDQSAMARSSRELRAGVDAEKLMRITPLPYCEHFFPHRLDFLSVVKKASSFRDAIKKNWKLGELFNELDKPHLPLPLRKLAERTTPECYLVYAVLNNDMRLFNRLIEFSKLHPLDLEALEIASIAAARIGNLPMLQALSKQFQIKEIYHTLLTAAIQSSSGATVDWLLEQEKELPLTGPSADCPLQEAAMRPDTAVLLKLLQSKRVLETSCNERGGYRYHGNQTYGLQRALLTCIASGKIESFFLLFPLVRENHLLLKQLKKYTAMVNSFVLSAGANFSQELDTTRFPIDRQTGPRIAILNKLDELPGLTEFEEKKEPEPPAAESLVAHSEESDEDDVITPILEEGRILEKQAVNFLFKTLRIILTISVVASAILAITNQRE